MPDIIQLLTDSVANQIAAGEVVQRPASVVKELMENAIDAGATSIQLIIKNSGKTLIQLIDDGKGMSDTDARLSLERHATSKIKRVEDLFSLTTMGFRGEALPSIAAVSQMEIKTRKEDSDLGTHLILEGSEVKSQEVCQCSTGTSILVKNLFFNIPARRNFLKSNAVENKHIIEAFLRIALINPEISMSLHSDNNELYHLPSGNFRQRIVNIFGKRFNERIVPVEESTDIVKISGFVGKAAYAKKTRGEQYLFVNNRYIKSNYFNHAIFKAYEDLLPSDQFPAYFLQLEVDPSKIDINIHPTKTEVKFEEERAIYAIIRTAVKQALGKYNVAPSLDFNKESSFDIPPLKKGEAIRMPSIQVDPTFNPFEREKSKEGSSQFPFQREKNKIEKSWEKLYQERGIPQQNKRVSSDENYSSDKDQSQKKVIQLHNKYILSHIKSGFIIIDQQRAHQRILYENLSKRLKEGKSDTQKLLFPENISLNIQDMALVKDLMEDFKTLGFDIREFGKTDLIVHGAPAELKNQSVVPLIEQLIEDFKTEQGPLKNKAREKLIRSLARSLSIKPGKTLTTIEMQQMIDELFACEMANFNFDGNPIIVTYPLAELDKQFKRK